VTEAEIRTAILEALEAYTYRLRTEFVRREEFQQVAQEGQTHGTTLRILESEFASFRKDFSRFAAVAEKIGWYLITTISTAIILAVLSTILL
jgi:formate dehydrogenase assembly factor FdhD